MASNCSTTHCASTETPKDALAAVARHGARIQIAAIAATREAVADWARSVHRFAHAVSDELLRDVHDEPDSGALIVRVAVATNVHLHELAALPGTAADRFETRLFGTQEVSR